MNGYTECSKCGKWFTQGTLATEFQGFGKKICVPRGRWYGTRKVKRISFAILKPVCPGCGGERIPENHEVPLWKQAKEAWNGIQDPELIRMRGKRGG